MLVDLSLPPKPVSADPPPHPPPPPPLLKRGTTTTTTTTRKTSPHPSASSPSSLPKHTPNAPSPRRHEPRKTPSHCPNGKNGQKKEKTSCLCDSRYLGGVSPMSSVISSRGGRRGRCCWGSCRGPWAGLDRVSK